MTMHDVRHYLAGAEASWFLKYKAVPPTNVPESDCPKEEEINVDIVDNLGIYKTHLSPIVIFLPFSEFAVNSAVSSSQITIICNNQ